LSNNVFHQNVSACKHEAVVVNISRHLKICLLHFVLRAGNSVRFSLWLLIVIEVSTVSAVFVIIIIIIIIKNEGI